MIEAGIPAPTAAAAKPVAAKPTTSATTVASAKQTKKEDKPAPWQSKIEAGNF